MATASFARHSLTLARAIPSATGGNRPRQERLYLRLEDGGEVGYGEAAPHPTREPAVDVIESDARAWLERAPTGWWNELGAALQAPGILQLAALDLLARRAKRSLAALLELPAPRQKSSLVTYGGDPATIASSIAADGPPGVKLKLVGDGRDIERLEAALSAGAAPVAVDANGAWNRAEAENVLAEFARLTTPERLLWVEQPCPAELLTSPLKSEFLVFADEAVEEEEFRLDCYDGVVLKPARRSRHAADGLARAIELGRLARAADKEVVCGCHLQSWILSAATLQLTGLVTMDWIDLDTLFLVGDDPTELANPSLHARLEPAPEVGLGVAPLLAWEAPLVI